MAITVTLEESNEIKELAEKAFTDAASLAAHNLIYGIKVNDNYKELYIYWNAVKNWDQGEFVSAGYNNIITKEDLLKIQSRINHIK